MKHRKHRTPEQAISKIMGEITDEGAGEAVGKTANLVHKWSDPDLETLPNIKQCITLDKAYLAAGNSVAPILECYTRLIEAEGLRGGTQDILLATLALTTAIGQISAAVQSAKAPTGPDGSRVNAKEREQIKKAIDHVRAKLDEMEGGLKSPALREVG